MPSKQLPLFRWHVVAFLFLLIFPFGCSSQFDLDFQGTITDTSERPLGDAIVQVIDSKGRIVTVKRTNGDGSYRFRLSTMASDKYTVFVKREGYVTKKFQVSTANIPDAQRGTKFPSMVANPTLFKPVPGVDYSALEKPMVEYYYDPAKDVYVIDQEKLAAMRLVLQRIREQEQKLKPVSK